LSPGVQGNIVRPWLKRKGEKNKKTPGTLQGENVYCMLQARGYLYYRKSSYE
jgi:hypothetical protein